MMGRHLKGKIKGNDCARFEVETGQKAREKESMEQIIQKKLVFDIQQNMISSISIATLTVLLLIQPLQGICLSTNQLDGLCTACPSTYLLSSGFCLPPIPNCLLQLSPHLCGSCSLPYILVEGQCLDPLNPNTPTSGALSWLETYVKDGPDLRYELIDYRFKTNHWSQLWDKISNVSMAYHRVTTYGHLYALTYTNPYSSGSAIYRAEGLVDYFNNVTEFRFAEIASSSLNDYSLLLWYLDRKVKVQNTSTLISSSLNQVQQLSSNIYRFFYIAGDGKIHVKDVQRVPDSTTLTFPILTQLAYQINENTVINYIFSLFPRLQLHSSYTLNFYTMLDLKGYPKDYYKFIFDSQIIVIIQVDGTSLSLYSYDEPDNVIPIPANQVGGYLPLPNLQDSYYVTGKNYLLQTYTFLTGKTLESVRYQIVSGTNYMLEYNNQPYSQDSFVAIIFVSLAGTPSVTHLYKNGVDVVNNIVQSGVPGAFNYEADPSFRTVYSPFKSGVVTTLKNVLPITSVQYVVNPDNSIDYLVIYNTVEYAFLRYYPTSYQILSYTAYNINVTVTIPPAQTPQRTEVLTFLQTQKPTLFTTTVPVKFAPELSIDRDGYEVDLLTVSGTYYTRVHKQGSLYYMTTITQNSISPCASLDPSEQTGNSVVSSLDTYIKANYWQVSGYTLSLVQGYINASGYIGYRMVYSSGTSRQEVKVTGSGSGYSINTITGYSGTGCDPASVLLNGVCKQDCLLFPLW